MDVLGCVCVCVCVCVWCMLLHIAKILNQNHFDLMAVFPILQVIENLWGKFIEMFILS